MIRHLAVTILFALAFLSTNAQDMTLSQTLDYLQQKIDKFGHFESIKGGVSIETKLSLISGEKDQCIVKLTETKTIAEATNLEKVKSANSSKYVFELKHIDKSKIDIYGTDGYVNPITLTIRAKNSSHNIRITKNDGKESYDFKSVLKFRANLKDIERLKKAFAHAVDICESMDVDPFD